MQGPLTSDIYLGKSSLFRFVSGRSDSFRKSKPPDELLFNLFTVLTFLNGPLSVIHNDHAEEDIFFKRQSRRGNRSWNKTRKLVGPPAGYKRAKVLSGA